MARSAEHGRPADPPTGVNDLSAGRKILLADFEARVFRQVHVALEAGAALVVLQPHIELAPRYTGDGKALRDFEAVVLVVERLVAAPVRGAGRREIDPLELGGGGHVVDVETIGGLRRKPTQ